MQNICFFSTCNLFKDRCQKIQEGNHIREIFNVFKLIIFNDLHWFLTTYPCKMSVFQANVKFNDFSRQDWNTRLFQACMNHAIRPCTVVITSLLVRTKPLEAATSVKRVYWDSMKIADGLAPEGPPASAIILMTMIGSCRGWANISHYISCDNINTEM